MVKKKYKNKRDRFLEVAEKRTNAVLERIRILGNCANKNIYEYENEEIVKIFKIIQKQLDDTKLLFKKNKRKKKFKF